jgi:hypothetical protein
MLIAEDLLLLLTDDRTGKLLARSAQVDLALGGALLIELALLERVDVARGRLLVADESPTTDGLLDETLALLASRAGKKPRDVVRRLGKGVRGRLYARLAERGVLRAERGKILGLLPVQSWPSSDSAHETGVREILVHALRTGAADDARTRALVALLHALKAVDAVIAPASLGVSKRELNANARRIGEDSWGAQAVREAIDALNAAAASGAIVASGSG